MLKWIFMFLSVLSLSENFREKTLNLVEDLIVVWAQSKVNFTLIYE